MKITNDYCDKTKKCLDLYYNLANILTNNLTNEISYTYLLDEL